jgi:pimeloyl-ACP methyl ester carboxylesterase
VPTEHSDVAAIDYAKRASYARTSFLGGTPVLLLHGLGGDISQLWGTGRTPLSGYPSVIAADARLHGATRVEAPRGLDFTSMAEDQIALVRHLDLPEPLILIGVSMGAGTAIRMSQLAPTMVGGLVLIRPAWLDSPFPRHLAPLTEVGEILLKSGTSDGRARFLASRTYKLLQAESPSAASSVLAQFSKAFAVARARRLIDVPGSTPVTSRRDLADVPVPTMVIGARADPLHPIEVASIWAALIPAAELHILPSRDANPRRYQRTLRHLMTAFLAQHSDWSPPAQPVNQTSPKTQDT